MRSSGSLPCGCVAPAGVSCDAGFFGKSNDPLGAAFGNVEADEVTALGLGPSYVGYVTKLLAKDVEHLLEFGRDQCSMPIHQLQNSCLVLQETNMTQLVDLVGTNRSRRKSCEEPLTLSFEAANTASPAPASVILDVDAKTNGRFGCP